VNLKEVRRNDVRLIKLATDREFVELSDYQLLRKASDPRCCVGSYTGIKRNAPKKPQERLG
jgi:hypothetical protein